jgi:hypothetical protein
MSKCKTVQDEKKINELVVRQKEQGEIIQKRALKSTEKVNKGQTQVAASAHEK